MNCYLPSTCLNKKNVHEKNFPSTTLLPGARLGWKSVKESHLSYGKLRIVLKEHLFYFWNNCNCLKGKGSFCKRDVFLFFSENSLYAERTPKMIPRDLHGYGMPLADKYSSNSFTTQCKKDALNSAQSNPIRHPYEPIWFNLLPLILREWADYWRKAWTTYCMATHRSLQIYVTYTHLSIYPWFLLQTNTLRRTTLVQGGDTRARGRRG